MKDKSNFDGDLSQLKILFNEGKFEDALRNYVKLIKISNKSPGPKLILNNIKIRFLIEFGKYEEGLLLCNSIEKEVESQKISNETLQFMTLHANLLIKNEKTINADQKIEYGMHIINIKSKKQEHIFDEALIELLNLKGIIFKNLDDNTSAIIKFKQSIELQKQFKSPLRSAYTHLILGTLHLIEKEYLEGQLNFDIALKIFKKINYIEGIYKTVKLLQKIHEYKKEHEISAQYQEEVKEYIDLLDTWTNYKEALYDKFLTNSEINLDENIYLSVEFSQIFKKETEFENTFENHEEESEITLDEIINIDANEKNLQQKDENKIEEAISEQLNSIDANEKNLQQKDEKKIEEVISEHDTLQGIIDGITKDNDESKAVSDKEKPSKINEEIDDIQTIESDSKALEKLSKVEKLMKNKIINKNIESSIKEELHEISSPLNISQDTNVSNFTVDINKLNHNFNNFIQRYMNFEFEISKKIDGLIQLNEQVNISKFHSEISQVLSENSQFKVEIEDSKLKMESSKTLLKDLEEQFDDKLNNMKKQIKELKNSNNELDEKKTKLETDIQYLKANKSKKEEIINQLNAENKQLKTKIEKISIDRSVIPTSIATPVKPPINQAKESISIKTREEIIKTYPIAEKMISIIHGHKKIKMIILAMMLQSSPSDCIEILKDLEKINFVELIFLRDHDLNPTIILK